jgi:hypothetical protein
MRARVSVCFCVCVCVCVCVCACACVRACFQVKSEVASGVPVLTAALGAPALSTAAWESFGLLVGDEAALTVAATAAIMRGEVNLVLADAEDGVTGVVAEDERAGFSFSNAATACNALVNSKNDGSG